MEHLARSGEPFLSWVEWLNFMEECHEKGIDPRRVAETWYGPYWISTVWLAYGVVWGETPQAFETVVECEGIDHYLFESGYATIEQALEGHSIITEAVISSVEASGKRFPLKMITAG